MVQIGARSTPECQEGVQSPGEQPREEHWAVHHVQVKKLSRTLLMSLSHRDWSMIF